MSIGLITYHWVANYGANLQMLSTYKYLESRGLSPIVINWIPAACKSYYEKVAGIIQMKCHLDFLNRHCRVTREFSDQKEIHAIIKDYDIRGLVIGSDSLFNIMMPRFNVMRMRQSIPTEDHTWPNLFWCYDIKIPHVALSVSSQNASYKKFHKEKTEIGKALKRFNAISVRDDWTKEMVLYFTRGEIAPPVTPDPVFAFNKNVPQDIDKNDILNKFHLPEKYVLFTFNEGRMKSPQKWIEEIKRLFHEQGITCVYLPRSTGSQNLVLDYSIKMPIDPMDWYNLIRFSAGYIGVLMHPIVVCLHNSVPFYSFDHYGKGHIMFASKESSKIYHILKKADILSNHFFLKNHIFFPDPYEVFMSIVNFPIDKIKKFSSEQGEECLANMNNLTLQLGI